MTTPIPTLSAAPPAPSRAQDNATFNARMAAMMAHIEQRPAEENAWAGALQDWAAELVTRLMDLAALSFTATSATNVVVGNGAKAFQATPGAAFLPGHAVLVTSRGDPASRMRGTVTAYDRATGALTVAVTASAGGGGHADWDIALTVGEGAPLASPAFTGTPTAPTPAAGTNTGQLATTGFVQAAIAAVVGGAPGQLDALNELAAALGNDADFAATVMAALASKANTAALGSIAGLAKASAAEFRAAAAARALAAAEVWAAAQHVVLVDAPTIAVDLSTFFNATITLGGNRILSAPINGKPGQSGSIEIRQDATGSRTLAYATAWSLGATAPSLSTVAGTRDILRYEVLSDGKVDAYLSKAR